MSFFEGESGKKGDERSGRRETVVTRALIGGKAGKEGVLGSQC